MRASLPPLALGHPRGAEECNIYPPPAARRGAGGGPTNLTADVDTRWRQLTAKLAKFEAIGVEITHEGDAEAAGWAPENRLDDVLKILAVVRLHPGNPNPTLGGLERHGAAQRRRAG